MKVNAGKEIEIGLISTHNANNYGAILQVYALATVLQRFGKVTVINYKNTHLEKSFRLVRCGTSVKSILSIGKDVLRLKSRRNAIRRFQQFIKQELKIGPSIEKNDLSSINFEYLVSGSDQIWNPACVTADNKLDDAYFLNFSNGATKFSYASSYGGYNFNETERIELLSLLKSFKRISVREDDAKLYLSELLKRQITHVLDPTLLLDHDDWNLALNIGSPIIKGKYILVYSVPKVNNLRSVVQKIRSLFDMQVVVVNQDVFVGCKADITIRDAGPLEFINLFNNANYVVTDSFHGTCFSLNFKKPFVVVTEGKHSNRIKSLLDIAGAKERLLLDSTQVTKNVFQYDLDECAQRIKIARRKSIKFIENCFVESE